MHPYQKIIQKALEQIKRDQSPDGSFLSLSSANPNDFSRSLQHKTTFFTSNILLSLQALAKSPLLSPSIEKDLKEIQEKGTLFLLAQKSKRWSFNYLAQNPKETIKKAYPDDLDDTFAAIAAILHCKPEKIDGKVWATIVRSLTYTEASEGGPFRTWIIPDTAPAKWKDVDLVVNSTIGYCLSLIDTKIPNIKDFIDRAVKGGFISSPYYPGFYQITYFVSRFYRDCKEKSGEASNILFQTFVKNRKERAGNINILEQAMTISILANLGRTEGMASDYLTNFIDRIENEGFKSYAFCIDPARGNKRYYAGSASLTAALCVEALANHYSLKNISITKMPDFKARHAYIQTLARERSENIGGELENIVLEQINRTHDERITSLAYDVQTILKNKRRSIPKEITEDLALANLYGWMAYKIYDDLLDDEGNPLLLPCANFFLRKVTEIYHYLDKSILGAGKLFEKIMNIVDNADIWEQNHCRIATATQDLMQAQLPLFENYANLADRSIGHALGPLTQLLSFGYDDSSEENSSLMRLFRHYLIARQLHDDAHDWEKNLLNGRINSVCALLLMQLQNYHAQDKDVVLVNDAIPKLRKIFWREIIDRVTDLILFHIDRASDSKTRSTLFRGTDLLEKELTNLGTKARSIFSERAMVAEFFNHYQPNLPYGDNS
jgi:hypothetical protein